MVQRAGSVASCVLAAFAAAPALVSCSRSAAEAPLRVAGGDARAGEDAGVSARLAPRASSAAAALHPDRPGARGCARGLALHARKALVTGPDGRGVIDDALLVVRDGRIASIAPAREAAAPADCEFVECGERWICPGFVDLHCHIAGKSFLVNDINDVVYMTNPELRVSAAVEPQTSNLLRAVAGGVTSVLFIPGSGSNMGGQGVLLKTGLETYDEMQIRNPGSLKLAQAGNPERWAIGVGRSLMNWNTRNTFERGLAYARRWHEHEQGRGPRPEKDIQWEIFRELLEKRTQISTHTQWYQVVLMTITMVRRDLGLDVYIDHGEWAGMRAAPLAQELGVPAILGPRELDGGNPAASPGTDGRLVGIAAGYQQAGHQQIGFNTDSPIVPEEELPVQATVSVHYGFDNSRMDAVRGLTIVPALTAGIDTRVGSLTPGRDADILVTQGDPIDPRNAVEIVFIEGQRVYDAQEGRLW